ncbi:MAG: L-threonine 3-dehydrogenase [Candidatus Brocadiia bacterium]
MAKMKAIIKPKAAPGAELVDVDIPKIGPTDLLVKVKATSICGTDAHIYNWDAWSQSRIKPPLIMGHEFAGEVVEIGPMVRGFAKGDFISAESHIPCGYCYQCRNDQQHICSNLKILGVDINGCFAEYVALPSVCAWKNDKSLPPEIASIQEPLGNAVYATLCEDVAGQTTAVFGCGPAGMLTVGVANAGGAAKIIHIIRNDFLKDLSKKMGSTMIIAWDDPKLVDKIMKATDGVGVDVVLEMSGSPEAMNQGLEIVRKGGRYTAFGLAPEQTVSIRMNDLIFKGARIIAINGRQMFRTWYQMAGLLNSGRLNPAPVITHKFKMSEFKEAFALIKPVDRKSSKVVLFP